MKILHITIGLASGGAERFVVDLANEQSKSNDVTLLTLKNDEGSDGFYFKEVASRVKYVDLGIKEKLGIKTLSLLYRKIRNINPDVAHFHLQAVLYAALPYILLNRRPLYVQTLHNDAKIAINSGGPVLAYLTKLIYKLSLVKLVTISKANRASFKTECGFDSASLIYNGRNKPLCHQPDTIKNELEKYKNNRETLIITHIGRCCQQKNQRLLITSFNQAVQEGANAILLIIGEGYDSEEGIILKKMAGDHIFFMGGQRYVADYLLNSDAFVLSSLFEGMPIALIEAFACGCIPLSTPVSGSIDLIQDGINGFISADFSENSFLVMLKRFFTNHKKIDKDTLKQYFEKELIIEHCTTKYMDMYKKYLRVFT